MTKDDVLFGYRLRLFALAGEVGRVRGVPRDGRASLDLLPLEGFSGLRRDLDAYLHEQHLSTPLGS